MSLQNKLKTQFFTTAAAAALVASLSAPFAYAGGTSDANLDPETRKEYEQKILELCTPPIYDGVPAEHHAECASPGFAHSMSLEEIKSSGLGENIIILHFGKGFYDASLDAIINTEDGAPTLAIPGGPDGKASVLIDGRLLKKQYTQSNADRGVLAAGSHLVYTRYMTRKGIDPSTVELPEPPIPVAVVEPQEAVKNDPLASL